MFHQKVHILTLKSFFSCPLHIQPKKHTDGPFFKTLLFPCVFWPFIKKETLQNPKLFFIVKAPAFLRPLLLKTGLPLIFAYKQRDKSLIYIKQRYLKTESGPYLLPPLKVSLEHFFTKTLEIKTLEENLFISEQNRTFYFGGCEIDRLKSPAYKKALFKKQDFLFKRVRVGRAHV